LERLRLRRTVAAVVNLEIDPIAVPGDVVVLDQEMSELQL
jgi:hypothetical protein